METRLKNAPRYHPYWRPQNGGAPLSVVLSHPTPVTAGHTGPLTGLSVQPSARE